MAKKLVTIAVVCDGADEVEVKKRIAEILGGIVKSIQHSEGSTGGGQMKGKNFEAAFTYQLQTI